ncbi:MAG TPA: hypothetical protein VKD91_11345, partial [Pyrinomonadaceae bacterium]|nr:hypothetical protein [Pyrinomonadaceae bacterium]
MRERLITMRSYHHLRLLLSTLRYLTPAQVWYRGRRIIVRRWWAAAGKRPPQPKNLQLAHHRSLYAGLCEITAPGPWKDGVIQA